MKKMSLQRLAPLLLTLLGTLACQSSSTDTETAALTNEVAVAEDYLISSPWLSEVRDEPVQYLKVAYPTGDSLFIRLLLVPVHDKIYATGNGFLHEKGEVIWAEGWADSSQVFDIQIFTQDSIAVGQFRGKLSEGSKPMQFIRSGNSKPALPTPMNSREKSYFLSRISPLLSLKLTACPNKTMHYFGIHPQHQEYKLWVAMQNTAKDVYVPQAIFITTAAHDDVIQYLPLRQSVALTAQNVPEMTRKSKQYFDLQDINQDRYNDIRFAETQTAVQKIYRYLIYDREENIFLPLPLAANDYFRAQK
ncbi:hypothetical protein [Rhodoflexus caldus]|uniref:hypothetical protein n=1 Tax=Rhodoflexus caldus TaxID=2891236 RepID=UPI00202A3717|nr:hypothetical protein [Rhodoflexus caldus]